jgi:Ca2+ transporting ATPase
MEHNTLIDDYPTVSIQECQDIVNGYMQREKGVEDIDLIQEKGGQSWLLNGFKTSLETGIDEKTLSIREEKYSNNKKDVVPPRSWFYFAWEAMEDVLLRVLFFSGIFNIVLEMSITDSHEKKTAWIEGFAILVAVTVIVAVTATNNKKKENEFNKLNIEAESGKLISILRNGRLLVDVSYEIAMVGDIIILKSGIEVPTDCILVEGFSVQIDESSVTGESKPMNKFTHAECLAKRDALLAKHPNGLNSHDAPSSVILSGTKILNGNGKMVVINVGKYSAIGKINELVNSGKEDELTPLQLKLEKLARDIAMVGLVCAIVLFLTTLIKWIVENSKNKDAVLHVNYWKSQKTSVHVKKFFKIFLTAVTILVVAIPEGLPLAVTLSLAFSVSKMMTEKNLVRKLAACETMGSATVICSDKTGTLTKNEMYFTDFFNLKENIVYDSVKGQEINYSEILPKDCHEMFVNTIVYNSLEDPTQKRGNPTEMALLKYMMMCKVDVLAKRAEVKKLFQATFTSDRKRMSTIVQLENGKAYAFLKGASEYVLESCDFFHDTDTNSETPMNFQRKKEFESAIEKMAKKALRTIGLAYKEVNFAQLSLESPDERGLYEYEKGGFNVIGVCGIKDVIRPEVPDSIMKCRIAGINVKMVTGDNKTTAYAIAKEVGIINEENESRAIVMEGPEFLRQIGGIVCENCLDKAECDCVAKERDLEKEGNEGKKVRKDVIKNKEVFDSIWPNLCVLARSRPEDKYALVTGIKNNDHVVAVTGDGTNDAPALSKANVGFAMNIAGTEVAKNAADILLMDDNFASIIVAVKWGRHIYASIQKFLQLQLAVTIVAVVMTFISAVILDEPIFSTVQMLWTNLVMDTLAALALATEPPDEEVLKRKPVAKNDYMITVTMMKHFVGQALFQVAILCICVFEGPKFLFDHTNRPGQRQPNSVYIVNGFEKNGYDNQEFGFSVHAAYNFNIFLVMTIFNFFNCRILDDKLNIFHGLKESHLFMWIVAIIFALQVLFVTFAGPAIKIAMWGLHPSGWLLCIAFGICTWIVAFLLKFIPTYQMNLGVGSEPLRKEDLNKKNSLGLVRKSHNQNFFKRQESIRRPSQSDIKGHPSHQSLSKLPSVKEALEDNLKFS